MKIRNSYALAAALWLAVWILPAGCRNNTGTAGPLGSPHTEHFIFESDGIPMKGKIHLPAAFSSHNSLPAIFLIDYTEQHFRVATDEFEQLVAAAEQVPGPGALVVSLEDIPDIDVKPEMFRETYLTYRDMASWVNERYTRNTNNTFAGRGSESSIVLMTLFLEDPDSAMFDNFIVTDPSPWFTATVTGLIEQNNFPGKKQGKKLHFSFSTSNERESCIHIIGLIREARYPWLDFAWVEYTDLDYEHTYPVSFAAGIRYIYGE